MPNGKRQRTLHDEFGDSGDDGRGDVIIIGPSDEDSLSSGDESNRINFNQELSNSGEETISNVSTLSDDEGVGIGEYYEVGDEGNAGGLVHDSGREAHGWDSPSPYRPSISGENPFLRREGAFIASSASDIRVTPGGQAWQLLCNEVHEGINSVSNEGEKLPGKRDRSGDDTQQEEKRLRVQISGVEDERGDDTNSGNGGLSSDLRSEEEEYSRLPFRFTNAKAIQDYYEVTVKFSLRSDYWRREWLSRAFTHLVEYERGEWEKRN